MRIARENGTLVLKANLVESRLLSGVLHALIRDYRLAPGQLDAPARGAWYSTRGCESAKISTQETAEWIASLHEGKGAMVNQLQRWAGQLDALSGDGSGVQLSIAPDDVPGFMTAINDYRLLAAARHQIGQAEMEVDWSDPAAGFSPERQRALLEIDFLAWIIEMMLYAAAS